MSTPTTSSSAPTGWIIATVVSATLAVAGILAGLLLVFAPARTTTGSKPEEFLINQPTSTSSHHNRPINPNLPTPVVRPSATIKLLQEQLGQLNYYNGPITGYLNHATVQAISYLQRDAHLPQTGQLNTATENALNAMLHNGNNQMNN